MEKKKHSLGANAFGIACGYSAMYTWNSVVTSIFTKQGLGAAALNSVILSFGIGAAVGLFARNSADSYIKEGKEKVKEVFTDESYFSD